jgi:toxin YoeB
MRKIAFLPNAFDDFNAWVTLDKNIHDRIIALIKIKDMRRDPFRGIGKPKPLKEDLHGLWSRRITQEHRLVYAVLADEIVITSCKFHYAP